MEFIIQDIQQYIKLFLLAEEIHLLSLTSRTMRGHFKIPNPSDRMMRRYAAKYCVNLYDWYSATYTIGEYHKAAKYNIESLKYLAESNNFIAKYDMPSVDLSTIGINNIISHKFIPADLAKSAIKNMECLKYLVEECGAEIDLTTKYASTWSLECFKYCNPDFINSAECDLIYYYVVSKSQIDILDYLQDLGYVDLAPVLNYAIVCNDIPLFEWYIKHDKINIVKLCSCIVRFCNDEVNEWMVSKDDYIHSRLRY